MTVEVCALDHVYVTVSDVGRAERFYDPVMQALGFRKGTLPIGGEPHVHYFNRVMQYSLRPARNVLKDGADPYRVGSLHHLCLRVRSPEAVDEAYRLLSALGIDCTEPRLYPEYRPDYYATFFSDPDGIRLEVVGETQMRRVVRERWGELSDFEDPVRKLLARDAAAGSQEALSRGAAGNLWEATVPAEGERFDELVRLGSTRIERIVSSEFPATDCYDQDHDEWVILLRGSATLEVEGHEQELSAGAHVTIRAGTRHRVLRTSPGALWLAVHVHRE